MNIILPVAGTRDRYPKGNIIQGYKENVAMYMKALKMAGHNGWDIVKFYGADVLAPHDGTVVMVDFQGQGYGNRVDILGPEENGKYLVSTLGHLTEEKLVKVGDKVKMGDVVGKMGNSGFVVSGGVEYWGQANPDKKGTHTHWTPKYLHRTKPGEQGASVTYMSVPYIIENYNNGVFGAIDPASLFGPQQLTKYFKTSQEGKLGIMIIEGFSGTLLFENDFTEYQTLLNIVSIRADAPTIALPPGKFFRINDNGKLGIMVVEGFTGTLLFENDFAEYQQLLKISAITDATPEIKVPQL